MSNYIDVLALVVAMITVIVSAYYNHKSIEETRAIAKQQFQFQFFAEYTKRYQDLMLSMPKDLDTSSIFNKDVDTYMRLYFDLCSEEYYLHSQGVIDNFVWGLWTEGIKTAMNKEKYQAAWKLLGDYYDDPSFKNFMSDIIRSKS